MMHKSQDKPAQGAATLKFFDWAYASGDGMANDLDYVPMPDQVKTLVRKLWSTVVDASGKPVFVK
jgi:phosphate transport system substrate-binding protein